jgi:hypothetical protein
VEASDVVAQEQARIFCSHTGVAALGREHPRSRIERILGLNLRRFLAEILGDLERRRPLASAGSDDLARGA